MDEHKAQSVHMDDFDSSVPSGAGGHHGNVSIFDNWLVGRMMALAGNPPVTVVLWDGAEAWQPPGRGVARVLIKDRRTLAALVLNPELHFGDAYSEGRVQIEGELLEFLEALYRSLRRVMTPGSWRRDLFAWLNRPRDNTLDQSRHNIHQHYDLGNDFYRLWLDERMVYTCAYYPSPSVTLAEAQLAKMDHVSRKLQLRPGQTVVEAGCGWGALAMHMARHYGVRVRAFNISHEQVAYARERAVREGLADRVEFVEDDYRNIEGSYHAFVSVGMLEHVGVDNYRTLGAVAKRCLRPGGRGLVHSIGRNYPEVNNPWIERRIFPGSRPPALSEMAHLFEPHDFSVLDVENLRLHYARTCKDWLARYERVADEVSEMFDERFVRAWRLYLTGSVAAFEVGSLQLFQVVFAHGSDNGVPLTREHLYAGAPRA